MLIWFSKEVYFAFWMKKFGSVQALMDIRDALRDPHGVLDSWDRNAVDPCSWAMVSCSEDQVVSL